MHISTKWIFTEPPCWKIFKGHVRTADGNMRAKFEVRSFNGLIDRSAAHRHTNRHTSNENSIPAIHFVHLAKIIIAALVVCYHILRIINTAVYNLLSRNTKFVVYRLQFRLVVYCVWSKCYCERTQKQINIKQLNMFFFNRTLSTRCLIRSSLRLPRPCSIIIIKGQTVNCRTRNVLDCDKFNYSSCIIFFYIFTLERNTKWIGWPVAEIWPFEIFQDAKSVVGRLSVVNRRARSKNESKMDVTDKPK